jgi:nicotinate phosphoribosyltransferase
MHKENYVTCVPLLSKRMEEGKRIGKKPPLAEIKKNAERGLDSFHKSYLRQINPHIYKVSLSSRLKKLKMDLLVAQRRKVKEEEASANL